jgi:hypothetical protein
MSISRIAGYVDEVLDERNPKYARYVIDPQRVARLKY